MKLRFNRRGMTILLGAVIVSTSAFGGTLWSLRNDTDLNVTLACERQDDGTVAPIKLMSQVIAARKNVEHDWGDSFYNDGMGLNSGHWRCSAESQGQNLATVGKFSTDWGENLKIVISNAGDVLVITKTKYR